MPPNCWIGCISARERTTTPSSSLAVKCSAWPSPRALINGPKILLADEPTCDLDSRNAEMIMQIFLDLNHDGLTIVLVTYNTELAQRAGRVIHLFDGRVVVAA